LGVVLALLGHGARFRLWDALEKVRAGLPVEAPDGTLCEVIAFVRERLRGLLLEGGLRYDAVNAVLSIPERYFDPARAAGSARQLDAWVRRADWQPTLDAYARCVRIVRDDPELYYLHPDRFAEPSEAALYQAYQAALAARGDAPDVDALLNAFVPMVPVITRFFDDVLVNTEDRALRENRHALLQHIAALAEGVADFSVLEGF
jgi:glycyl-tRNA synthetase beta subunit